MATEQTIKVFDSHNDVLLRLWSSNQPEPENRFLEGESSGHIDLPRARKGGLGGGLCAVYVPSPSHDLDADGNLPTPSQQDTLKTTLAMSAILQNIERKSEGQVRICRTAADIRDAFAKDIFASVYHIEGVEAFDADLDALYVLHAAGLRSLGPVWSRPNIFAHGIPFRFPSSPDIGPGLTDHGKALIRACNELKVMIDLSHMNEKGFWDIAALSDAPLVASHSNAHVLCQQSRNLTDRQLDAIRDTGGLVGLNFGVSFLREDGKHDPDTKLEELVRHADYIVGRIGIDHVAFGSDFDGTIISSTLRDVADLQLVIETFRKHGYDDASLVKLAHGNWIDVLERTWGK